MKTSIRSLVMAGGITVLAALWSCETNPEMDGKKDILPEKFSVDIPASITSSSNSSGRIKDDTLRGNAIYLQLGTFIAVGEASSKLVEAFIGGIRQYNIDRVKSLTYVSGDDGRTKNLVVFSDVTFEGKDWDYQLTITDADAEGNNDGGKALQIFWNDGSPIEGIAIIKPYNCNRTQDAGQPNTLIRIDYSEVDSLGYDSHMEVSIAGLPVPNPLENPFAMSTLKMFAGKTGNIVDVFGNSNHPNAVLFTGTPGFNWAFVASGNESNDKGVAEVGLPPSNLNTNDRNVILKQYSIKNVFTNQITALWPAIDQNILASYLTNTAAPGYFSGSRGFISGGVSPGADWTSLADRINELTPFNPSQVSNLTINFK